MTHVEDVVSHNMVQWHFPVYVEGYQFDDINKVFWFDNGNGIRSIIVETKFTDRMSYNVFGQDDFEDVLDCFSRENVKSEPEVGFLKYGYR